LAGRVLAGWVWLFPGRLASPGLPFRRFGVAGARGEKRSAGVKRRFVVAGRCRAGCGRVVFEWVRLGDRWRV
jgi:hypothetical protein